ncbi:MAG: alpha-amylase family glycosyl hydrolase [Planctomycetota bacterium]
MIRRIPPLLAALTLTGCTSMTTTQQHRLGESMNWASPRDRELAQIIEQREADWRCGPVVYHVFVDRFAPPSAERLEAKRGLFQPPRKLMAWSDTPARGRRLPDVGPWSHELEFWGGDLISLRENLDHIENIGADVVYLNPIHAAYTNHKYDAQDFAAVSPEYGTREDFIALAEAIHDRSMRLMLDGVFNHMGKTSPAFQEALADETSPYRAWFDIDERYRHGYRAWFDAANLPELSLERPEVRAYIYADDDAVVRQWLRDGADGWRLDVAYDYGPRLLAELTEAAHETKRGSWVVGEIWNYPEEWIPACDGVMNFHLRRIITWTIQGKCGGAHAGDMIERMVDDVGIDNLLRCWIVLDNHDTPRLATEYPNEWERRIAQALQFTLPGSPLVYYGVEAGMTGGGDPEMRGPMQWDDATPGNPEFDRLALLMQIRSENRALRVGEYRALDAEHLLAFQRRTDKVEETIFVVVNPTAKPVHEIISLRASKLMNFSPLRDLLTGEDVEIRSGLLDVTVPPQTVWILRPTMPDEDRYSPYKRVH